MVVDILVIMDMTLDSGAPGDITRQQGAKSRELWKAHQILFFFYWSGPEAIWKNFKTLPKAVSWRLDYNLIVKNWEYWTSVFFL